VSGTPGHRALVFSFSWRCVHCVLCNRRSAPQPTERPSPAPADVSDIYVWGSGHVGQLGLDPESEFELEDQYVVQATAHHSAIRSSAATARQALTADTTSETAHLFPESLRSRIRNAYGTKRCCTSASSRSAAAATGPLVSQVRARAVVRVRWAVDKHWSFVWQTLGCTHGAVTPTISWATTTSASCLH
jgi:hypothetical protein